MDLFERILLPRWIMKANDGTIVEKEFRFKISESDYENYIETKYVNFIAELCSNIRAAFANSDYNITYPDIEELKHHISINKNECINGFTKSIYVFNTTNKSNVILRNKILFTSPNLNSSIHNTINLCIKNAAIKANVVELSNPIQVEEDKSYSCYGNENINLSLTIHVPCTNPICSEPTKEYFSNAWIDIDILVYNSI